MYSSRRASFLKVASCKSLGQHVGVGGEGLDFQKGIRLTKPGKQ